MSILLVGGGNLGTALARGWLFPDRSIDDLSILTASGVARDPDLAPFTTTKIPVITPDTTIILAVKPHMIREAFAPLAPHIGAGQNIVSVAAGVRLEKLQTLAPQARWMRAMPSLAAAARQSVTGLLHADQNTANLFEQVGSIVRVESDEAIDAVTALVASGVGVVAWHAQLWLDAARDLIPDETALRRMIAGMIESSGQLLHNSNNFEDTVKSVATKGGTTEAMIGALAAGGVPDSIKAALSAALERAKEINQKF